MFRDRLNQTKPFFIFIVTKDKTNPGPLKTSLNMSKTREYVFKNMSLLEYLASTVLAHNMLPALTFQIPDREFLIRVGYIEIYNEKVSDLLGDEVNLKLVEDVVSVHYLWFIILLFYTKTWSHKT